MKQPHQSIESLAELGTQNLVRILAVDSQSDSFSATIPSSVGQRHLTDVLRSYFEEFGYAASTDACANLVVHIPARCGAASGQTPVLALMAHLDTSFGTQAVDKLVEVRAWDGSRIDYPENPHLQISADRYPMTQAFVGDDVLHGPGRAPVGFDDKLGIAEMMTLAHVLNSNPDVLHGEIKLVFRPDEEIGRMEAVEGLAETLKHAGVTHGYTIDGLAPFEINVENFHAARAWVDFGGTALEPDDSEFERVIGWRIVGVKTHGATAKEEGHLNATVVMARLWREVLRDSVNVRPLWMKSDTLEETSADVWFRLAGEDEESLDRMQAELESLLRKQIDPHGWKGARLEPPRDQPQRTRIRTDALERALEHIATFLEMAGPAPLLAEDSDGFQGYSNPHAVGPIRGDEESGAIRVQYRLRDFDRAALQRRKEHVLAATSGLSPPPKVDVADQYENMKPALEPYPELIAWASAGLRAMGRHPKLSPIRGGTGVDPFLKRGIPVANLGTGYFAPESQKELTSRQNIARHVVWLTHLVQAVVSNTSDPSALSNPA